MIQSASEFARAAHESQRRRYTHEPYFTHCEEVAEQCRMIGLPEAAISAAYLHDVVEDTETTIEKISELFGVTVAKYVWYLTEPTKGNRRHRKAMYARQLRSAPAVVQSIKLADLCCNLPSIIENDPKFAVQYVQEAHLLLRSLPNGNNWLGDRVRKILDDYKTDKMAKK